MSKTNGQEGLSPENAPETAGATQPDMDGEIVQTAAVLDEFADDLAPPQQLLPGGEAQEDPDLLDLPPGIFDAPPIETAASGPGPVGGGSSTYESDFGELIGGLQANGGETDTSGTTTPGNPPAPSNQGSDGPTFVPLVAGTTVEPTPEEAFVPPLNPVGPGADEALFTKKADNVDLNGIDVGGYKDGTQYDAGNGSDIVVLPGTAREALEAGFTPGTLFLAGGGNDQVTGGALADLIDGGNGHDLLIGGDGDDSLWGGRHNDTLNGGSGSDLILGGNNNDQITGDAGDDRLFGGSGRDTLDGGSGRDLLDGGGGNDSMSGGEGDDSLLGGSGHDTLDGGAANDALDGGNSNDSLTGGEGSDSLLGGSGRDTLDGGVGNDFLDGGSGNDSLAAGDGDDSLFGGSGRDTLDGGLGNDLLDGGSSHDLLIGGGGDDTLLGGAHHDTLIGGGGDDVMTGGSGRDVFSFSLASNEGDDLIMDFTTSGGNRDKLEISDLIDVNGDSVINIEDLDAGGHSVTGSVDSVVITFDTGSLLTLDGVNGTGVSSFDDLLDINVKIDIA